MSKFWYHGRNMRLVTINEGGRWITLTFMPDWFRIYFFGKVLNVRWGKDKPPKHPWFVRWGGDVHGYDTSDGYGSMGGGDNG